MIRLAHPCELPGKEPVKACFSCHAQACAWNCVCNGAGDACAGVGLGIVGAQNTVPPQYSSVSGSSYAQSTMASSAAAPLPEPQQPNSFRPDKLPNSNSLSDGPASSKPTQGGSRTRAKHLQSLPDISAEELPLKFVDRKKLEFSAERLKVGLPFLRLSLPSCETQQLCPR